MNIKRNKRKCQIVMLHTSEKSSGMICKDITKQDKTINIKIDNFMEHEDYIGQHLYITSDEKFKIGDWITDGIKIVKASPKLTHAQVMMGRRDWKLIIATTNTSLKIKTFYEIEGNQEILLPQLSQQFIQRYIEEYNKGRVISEVEVEYEDKFLGYFPNITATGTGSEPKYKIQLKLNPDNTINIKPIKDSLSKEDLLSIRSKISLIDSGRGSVIDMRSEGFNHARIMAIEIIDKWIEENL